MKIARVCILGLFCTVAYGSDGSIALDRDVLFELFSKAANLDGEPALSLGELEGVIGKPTRHDPVGASSNMPVRVYLVEPEGELQVTFGSGYVYSVIIVLKDGSDELVWK